nr:hypothetical protein [Maliibacterium massiliense]
MKKAMTAFMMGSLIGVIAGIAVPMADARVRNQMMRTGKRMMRKAKTSIGNVL